MSATTDRIAATIKRNRFFYRRDLLQAVLLAGALFGTVFALL